MLNGGETVGVCAVVIAECYSGARPLERPGWEEIFAALNFWETTPDDAVLAGTWRYDFARRGVQLTTTDLLIASVARRVGAVVVTSNARHFPMPDVQVLPML
jgi:predicted nucleic acid-binding protein